jgi:hypothetical protein
MNIGRCSGYWFGAWWSWKKERQIHERPHHGRCKTGQIECDSTYTIYDECLSSISSLSPTWLPLEPHKTRNIKTLKDRRLPGNMELYLNPDIKGIHHLIVLIL